MFAGLVFEPWDPPSTSRLFSKAVVEVILFPHPGILFAVIPQPLSNFVETSKCFFYVLSIPKDLFTQPNMGPSWQTNCRHILIWFRVTKPLGSSGNDVTFSSMLLGWIRVDTKAFTSGFNFTARLLLAVPVQGFLYIKGAIRFQQKLNLLVDASRVSALPFFYLLIQDWLSNHLKRLGS